MAGPSTGGGTSIARTIEIALRLTFRQPRFWWFAGLSCLTFFIYVPFYIFVFDQMFQHVPQPSPPHGMPLPYDSFGPVFNFGLWAMSAVAVASFIVVVWCWATLAARMEAAANGERYSVLQAASDGTTRFPRSFVALLIGLGLPSVGGVIYLLSMPGFMFGTLPEPPDPVKIMPVFLAFMGLNLITLIGGGWLVAWLLPASVISQRSGLGFISDAFGLSVRRWLATLLLIIGWQGAAGTLAYTLAWIVMLILVGPFVALAIATQSIVLGIVAGILAIVLGYMIVGIYTVAFINVYSLLYIEFTGAGSAEVAYATLAPPTIETPPTTSATEG